MPKSSLRTNSSRILLLYGLMVSVALAIFYLIKEQGRNLAGPAGIVEGIKTPDGNINTLLHVLLALFVVIVTARAIGSIFKIIGQPPVIGEVIGGIMLGPSLLGFYAPDVYSFILPASAAPFLGIIAQLGVILYMFLVGLELDLKIVQRSGHATLAISHASIIVPFLLGAWLALQLYPTLAMPNVPFVNFALFLGVSMSVTAFPVLARILSDRKIQKSKMGTIALTCAAVDDVSAWCLLAIVVSAAQAKLGQAAVTIILTVAYICLMFFVARPLIKRFVPLLETFDRLTEGGLAFILILLLLSALATEAIGIHAIFGAFLLGAVTPHDSRVANELSNRIEDLVRILFLPAFFAFTGMRTQIGLLRTQEDWITCGLIILVATIGKFGGTFVASKLSGLNWRDSAALGILMNTRGLVELIVLNIGLDLKIISPPLFAMLVIMALVTTFLTTPVLHVLTRGKAWH